MKKILLENGYVPILFVVTVFYIKETKKAKFEHLYVRNSYTFTFLIVSLLGLEF